MESILFTKKNKSAAILSILSNTILILLKYIAGFISGSISIISEATHSATDLLASIITFYSVIKSAEPADDDHPFGHGKYEEIASLLEGLLIILAALYIIYEAVKKITSGHSEIFDTTLGLWVMGISVVANTIISSYLLSTARKTGSTALHADGMHLRTDVYSSLAVLIGLVVIKFTGNVLLDAFIAIAVAIFIFNAGFKIYKNAEKGLLDVSLDNFEIEEIKQILSGFSEQGIINLKELKTRRVGFRKYIVLTLLVDGKMQISTSHKICDEIELAIEERLKQTDILIHLEPQD